MNSLLIPLSGESNRSGRAGGGLLLLRLSCCHLISSPVPGRSSPNLFRRGPHSPSSQSHALLPSELANIHFNGRDWNRVFLKLAAICLSLYLVLVGASASLSHCRAWDVLPMPWMGSPSVCLSPSTPTTSLGVPTSLLCLPLPCPSPPWTFNLTCSSFNRKLLVFSHLCPS